MWPKWPGLEKNQISSDAIPSVSKLHTVFMKFTQHLQTADNDYKQHTVSTNCTQCVHTAHCCVNGNA